MKYTASFFALIALICFFTQQASAQKTTYWKGGTPGHENDWFCAKNWTSGDVPNEFSNVVISDQKNSKHISPVIRRGSVSMNTLRLEGMASLEISAAAQVVVYEDFFATNLKYFKPKGGFWAPNYSKGPIAFGE
jgi:hypothetical protein